MKTAGAVAFLLARVLDAQPAAGPRFEVASIRLSVAERGSGGVRTGNGRLDVSNETLKRCIQGAYGVGPNQIVGGPDWLATDRFDIQAKAEDRAGDKELMLMLQNLLAERFQLVIRREARPGRAFLLESAKNGPKLEKSTGGSSTRNSRGLIVAQGATMAHLAEVIARQMDLPVVDRTGIQGAFDLKLEWNPDNTKPENGPSIFTAVQEQLGLRLASGRVPIETLVVERAAKPSEN
jgi:uncharacterized protein (TIGR03435 family)